MNKREDEFFYFIGKIIFIPLIVFGLGFSRYIYPLYIEGRPSMECKFRSIIGLPCPGCGGTRAFMYFFKGDMLSSFIYHPVVIYSFLAYILFMVIFFVRKNITKNIAKKPVRYEIFLYILVAVIFIQWFIKLYIILMVI